MIFTTMAMATAFGQTKPGVPPAIQAPAGHSAYLKAQATGTQNYICLPNGWSFLGPQATLYVSIPWFNGEVRQQVTTHYLSLNPSETATARATWLSSLDSSAVWAKAIANSSDPDYVAPGAIAWLLLEVVGSQRGPTGGALLSQAKYLQRGKTTGGMIPTKACTVGQVEFVPYTADYIFFKADR
jgi:hypothetical protein